MRVGDLLGGWVVHFGATPVDPPRRVCLVPDELSERWWIHVLGLAEDQAARRVGFLTVRLPGPDESDVLIEEIETDDHLLRIDGIPSRVIAEVALRAACRGLRTSIALGGFGAEVDEWLNSLGFRGDGGKGVLTFHPEIPECVRRMRRAGHRSE